MTMTWEAFRLTSKSPSEVYHVLGPHGVDDLIRKAMDVVWREYPEDRRTYENVKRRMLEVFERNMKHWSAIKKPTPQAFFDHLLPYAADGFVRQALVLTWMMMPRAGGRDFKQVKTIVADVFNRNLAAWDADNETFTTGGGKPRKTAAKKKAAPKKVAKRTAPKRTAPKRTAPKRKLGAKRKK
jgi:hypothetical protein